MSDVACMGETMTYFPKGSGSLDWRTYVAYFQFQICVFFVFTLIIQEGTSHTESNLINDLLHVMTTH